MLSQEIRTQHQRYRVRAASATRVETRVSYFPGWTVRVDGQVVDGMAFSVPAGEHEVRIDLERTPIRMASLLASLATLLLFVVRCGWRKVPKVDR